jgi:hypothetical protein
LEHFSSPQIKKPSEGDFDVSVPDIDPKELKNYSGIPNY